jgi:hypothetical protein
MIQLNDKNGSWVDPLDLRVIRADNVCTVNYRRVKQWRGLLTTDESYQTYTPTLTLKWRNGDKSIFHYDSIEQVKEDAKMLGEWRR